MHAMHRNVSLSAEYHLLLHMYCRPYLWQHARYLLLKTQHTYAASFPKKHIDASVFSIQTQMNVLNHTNIESHAFIHYVCSCVSKLNDHMKIIWTSYTYKVRQCGVRYCVCLVLLPHNCILQPSSILGHSASHHPSVHSTPHQSVLRVSIAKSTIIT